MFWRSAAELASQRGWEVQLSPITYDQKPRRRLWEVMKSQGMQENQQVVFMSDGGEDVRRVQEYLQPHSEHLIDWFHITMRVAVLPQRSAGREIHSCRIR